MNAPAPAHRTGAAASASGRLTVQNAGDLAALDVANPPDAPPGAVPVFKERT